MGEVNFRTLSRNSLFAAIVEFWRVGSRFILTPLIIGKLGMQGYGTWTLIFSVCGYADILNTSFANAYAKYTAEYDRKKDYHGLSQVISSGVMLMGLLGAIGWCAVYLLRKNILLGVNIPESLMDEAVLALPVIAAMMAIRLSLGCFYQVLAGLQRLDLQHKLNILASIIEFVVTMVLLLLGKGLMSLVIGHVSGQLIGLLLAVLMCRLKCPGIRLSIGCVSRYGFSKILSLGSKFQLLAIMGWAITDGLKILLGVLCSVPLVAQYDLAEKLLSLAKSLSSSLIAPLMPAFANLHAGDEHEKRTQLFRNSSKLVALTAMATLTVLVVFADAVLMMWTGKECPEAAWTIRVLAFGQFLWLMTGVGTASLRGRGLAGLEISNALIRTLIAGVTIYPLYKWIGFNGIVLSVFASRAFSSLWFLKSFARQEMLDFSSYVKRELLCPMAIGGFGIVVGYALLPRISGLAPAWPPRWQALFLVSVWGTCLGILTSVALWYGLFSQVERSYLSSKLHSLLHRYQKPKLAREQVVQESVGSV